jgi:hypothetical protein
MRFYIIGLMVGAIGLFVANRFQAVERCSLGTTPVFTVERWEAEPAMRVAVVSAFECKRTNSAASAIETLPCIR